MLRKLAAGLLVAACLQGIGVLPARAAENLDLQRSMGKIVIIDNERRALSEAGTEPRPSDELPKPGEPEAPEALKTSHNMAALPQVGYDPAAGAILGVEYKDINFGASNMNLEVGATQSTQGQTELDAILAAPHLLGTGFIGVAQLGYHLIRTQRFYGLGNNDVGGDALSTHEYRATSLLITLGRRLAPHWVVAATVGYDRTGISAGREVAFSAAS